MFSLSRRGDLPGRLDRRRGPVRPAPRPSFRPWAEALEDRTLLSVQGLFAASPGGGAGQVSTSADGRFVAFLSKATDLVPGFVDGNGSRAGDVFVRDVQAGTTTLVSVNSTGTAGGNGDSSSPVLSADGRFVAFYSTASDLVANDTNNAGDVFERDLKTGGTTLVSVNGTGTASGNGPSTSPSISADGRFVAFNSLASDLVANDTNGGLGNTYDDFVRDLQAGTTTLVSANSSGTDSGNDASFAPQVSADGTEVVFESVASDLVPNDTNGDSALGGYDVFVRNLLTATTALVSVNSSGTASGAGDSTNPVLSGDGQHVTFQSDATDLTTTPAGPGDVFVRNLLTATTALVSVNSSGTAGGNGTSFSEGISADGQQVLFESFASNLVSLPKADGVNTFDVYVRNVPAGTTTLVSVNSSGTATGNGQSLDPVISADGTRVAFDSFASDLVAKDTNGLEDVLVRDLQAGITSLVSVNSTSKKSGNGASSGPAISPGGRYVAFVSAATDLLKKFVDGNGPAGTDVFARDLQLGQTTLVSVNGTGTASGNAASSNPVLSAAGSVAGADRAGAGNGFLLAVTPGGLPVALFVTPAAPGKGDTPTSLRALDLVFARPGHSAPVSLPGDTSLSDPALTRLALDGPAWDFVLAWLSETPSGG